MPSKKQEAEPLIPTTHHSFRSESPILFGFLALILVLVGTFGVAWLILNTREAKQEEERRRGLRERGFGPEKDAVGGKMGVKTLETVDIGDATGRRRGVVREVEVGVGGDDGSKEKGDGEGDMDVGGEGQKAREMGRDVL